MSLVLTKGGKRQTWPLKEPSGGLQKACLGMLSISLALRLKDWPATLIYMNPSMTFHVSKLESQLLLLSSFLRSLNLSLFWQKMCLSQEGMRNTEGRLISCSLHLLNHQNPLARHWRPLININFKEHVITIYLPHWVKVLNSWKSPSHLGNEVFPSLNNSYGQSIQYYLWEYDDILANVKKWKTPITRMQWIFFSIIRFILNVI